MKAESINSLDAAGIASFMQSSTSDDDEVADFLATTDKETANAQVLGTKIEELAADIAAEEATEIRDKDAA